MAAGDEMPGGGHGEHRGILETSVNLLETEGMTLFVANAQHINAVPGRKTDVKDAEWIADLARHGLIKSSFIPSREQRELS
jgi:transposase